MLLLTQSKFYMLALTECVWEFRNHALWDTREHTLFYSISQFILTLTDGCCCVFSFNRQKDKNASHITLCLNPEVNIL